MQGGSLPHGGSMPHPTLTYVAGPTHSAQLDLTLVNNHHAGLPRCWVLSVCNLVLILSILFIAIVNDEICVALSPLACLMLIAYGRNG